MRKITKTFLITSALAFVTAFMPVNTSQAAIFEGSLDADGTTQYGLCLGWEPGEDGAPAECASVNCSEEAQKDNVLCISEASKGTNIAKGTLSSTGITHTENFGDFVLKLVNFTLPYLTLAAFVGYVVAGFLYVTALGNDEQIGKAKKILIWSSIGLIVIILSYTITNALTGDLVRGLAG